MYAPGYGVGGGGYGPGNPSSSSFTPSGAPQQPANSATPNKMQHMMYNHPQAQYYGGQPGPMGIMQNNGMAHMAGGHAVPAYQTPYSSSPYGNIPTSTAANLPPNFMPATSNASAYAMNAANNPQLQAQRMQPPPQSSTPTQPGPRASPFAGGVPNTTPPNAASSQSQFSTPQASSQGQSQTPNHNQTAQSGTILTPQTPNFPPGAQGGHHLATPLSPGSEMREKERVTVLLEINSELLNEAMHIQEAQAHEESKKDEPATGATSPDGTDKDKTAEGAKKPSRGYIECMRRLQSNLAYLAAIADRSHKPSSQIPPHPAIMSAPALVPRSPKHNNADSPKTDGEKIGESEEKRMEDVDEDRSDIIRDLYKKLQGLFPGVDPKKEPTMPNNAGVRPQIGASQSQQGQPGQYQQSAAQAQHYAAQLQAMNQQRAAAQQIQGGGSGGDPAAQQKVQADMMRQKIMQQQAQSSQMQTQQMLAQNRQ